MGSFKQGSNMMRLLVVLSLLVSMAIGGSVSGNGTVWCEGLMMVPWTPCEPYCENESAYCSPGGVNQKFAVKTKLDNGPDIFVEVEDGSITCQGRVSYSMDDSDKRPYFQDLPDRDGLFCGSFNCTGTFEAKW